MYETPIKAKSSQNAYSSNLKQQCNDTSENAKKYQQANFDNTYYLGYRDLPHLLQKFNVGGKAIDYGCGTGRSTRFLKSLDFQVLGVDLSKEMLKQTANIDDPSHYLLIKNGKIPVMDNSYDLFFSCFVFFVISEKRKLFSIFKEGYRCLKKGGFFMFVTGTEHLYSQEWLSYNVNFPENKKLKSGDIARIQLKDLDIEFTNYLWTEKDYEQLAAKSGFKILEKHFPLGKENEKQNWISEVMYPPYVVYIMQKNQ